MGRRSSRIPTGFHVSRSTRGPSWRARRFSYRAVTVSGGPFQATSPTLRFLTPYRTPHNPKGKSLRFRLFPFRSPLLGESRFLSLPRGTKMFQFPRSASHCPMDSGRSTGGLPPVGCPIRKSPDQSLLTAPRGISVLAPSFFGSWRQGIHRVPFTTSPQLLR